jgi:hypothetical protein
LVPELAKNYGIVQGKQKGQKARKVRTKKKEKKEGPPKLHPDKNNK